ncbi:MAG: DUF6166 domain-containing protein [Holophagales bacterium]|nr:DUF6166 domain-containing protein [Holophagales bacterium]
MVELRPQTGCAWILHRKRGWEATAITYSTEEKEQLIELLGALEGIEIGPTNPLATIRLPQRDFRSAEATVFMPPIAPDGPRICINTESNTLEIEGRERAAELALGAKPLNTKRQLNGRVGELRTEAILAKHFWILFRSVDVDGADLMIELPAATDSDLRHRRTRVVCHGTVQAKYCEWSNPVRVARDYVVEASGEPRSDFFLFIHSDREVVDDIVPVDYFFTAPEIVEHFSLTKGDLYYEFRLTHNREFEEFRDIRRRVIISRIQGQLEEASDRYRKELSRSLHLYTGEAGHAGSDASFTYLFRKLERTSLVLVRNEETKATQLLEPRRDLYKCFGGFEWGYRGTGPQFLTASLLAHHLGDVASTKQQRERFLDFLETRKGYREFDLSSRRLADLLGESEMQE